MEAISFVTYENASVRAAKAVFIPDSVGVGSGVSLMRLQATLSQPIPDAGSFSDHPPAKEWGFLYYSRDCSSNPKMFMAVVSSLHFISKQVYSISKFFKHIDICVLIAWKHSYICAIHHRPA